MLYLNKEHFVRFGANQYAKKTGFMLFLGESGRSITMNEDRL
jgi:hypothetical protein